MQRRIAHAPSVTDRIHHNPERPLVPITQTSYSYAPRVLHKSETDGVLAEALSSTMTIARNNMVEQQVRCWEVLDPEVLDVLRRVPREHFVPPAYRALAFADTNIPLCSADQAASGFAMMRPIVEGRLLQALEISAHDTVLEIGTGSGFLTACMAALAYSVSSIDISEPQLESAREKLTAIGVKNCELLAQDVFQRTESAEYDVIAITGSMPEYDSRFEQWLKLGGRAFMVVGRLPIMEAILVRRAGIDEWTRQSLFDTVLPALVHAPQRTAFKL